MSALLIPGHPKPRPREVSLEEIRACVGDCQLCPLGQTRTNLVFGVGNPHARVMFVGEGPGRNEDLQGEPFVGAAGQKLNSLLIRSIWPDVIVCLGNFATQFILKTELGVTKLRGRFHQTGHFTVMPTFHPAATIYHPDWLEDLRSDMQMLGAWLAEHPAGE